ncbi:MAG: dTDP-4-dehydrorhamnose 3,5-epimerase [Bacteroidetes bacterium]|nr:dTDP-4-dehydrorhamnose 3,5-epimerase [Bacteroidota bacterium]
MEIKEEKIKGILSIYPKVFGDDRGYFFESFNRERYDVFLPNVTFVQDNESCSGRNVLRGLHFQLPPFDQGKLVQVNKGKALDVVVDIRTSSETYGKHLKIILCSKNKNQLWIPPGFAHGFCALEEDTILTYKCTNYYSPENERSILWNDKILNIDWEVTTPIISNKDKNGIKFSEFISPFS